LNSKTRKKKKKTKVDSYLKTKKESAHSLKKFLLFSFQSWTEVSKIESKLSFSLSLWKSQSNKLWCHWKSSEWVIVLGLLVAFSINWPNSFFSLGKRKM